MTRMATEENVLALKTATKQLVHELGGIVAAETCTRVGVSQLSEYGNVQRPDRMMPVDVALDLELIAGKPRVTAEMARLQGYNLVPFGAWELHELIPALQRIAVDNGALFNAAVHALSGKSITLHEMRVMKARLHDMGQAVQEALWALEGKPE